VKTVIYARTSTADKQDYSKQLTQLRAYADSQGWTVVTEYVDQASGATSERDAFQELLRATAKGGIDLVLFHDLSRLSRQGALQTLMILEQWKARGVGFHSLNEPYISSLGPFADIVISILATVSKLERQRISEKTKQALAVVRQRGTKLGRPEKARWVADEVRRLASQGVPKTEIAKRLKVSRSCVYSALACEA
jgi:DNA invertase Pin-like site-specific DNA recombinase